LVAGGYGIVGANSFETALNSAELFDPTTGLWSPAGPMSKGRYIHTATLLVDGKVLLAGGEVAAANAAERTIVDIYDPSSNTWSVTGSLNSARSYHTATLLPNGKVLVTGGLDGSSILSSCELFDPQTNSWSTVAPLPGARYQHSATLLPNGKVLVAGGYGSATSTIASARIYDPSTDVWSQAGSMLTGHAGHTASLLADGKVLVAGAGYVFANGSYNLSGINSQVFDYRTNTWSSGGSKPARQGHTATLLPGGSVLLAGSGGYESSTELYSGGLAFSDSWRPVVSAPASVLLGSSLSLTGTQFTGLSEASGGNGSQNSSGNFPFAVLQSQGNEQQRVLGNNLAVNWSSTQLTTAALTNFPKGPAWLTVFVNGIPSVAKSIGVTSATSIAVSSSAASVAAGQPVTLTAAVIGSSPTGSVQFSDGGTPLGSAVPLSGGSAVLTTTGLATAGSHLITAAYSGDAGNAVSVSTSLIQVVTKASSSTTLDFYILGGFNGTGGSPTQCGLYTRAYVGGASPGGDVQFSLNGAPWEAPRPLGNTGQAGLAEGPGWSRVPAGFYAFGATYVGDPNNLGSQATGSIVTITAIPVTPSVRTSAAASGLGSTVTFTARMSYESFWYSPPSCVLGGLIPATGTVQFKVDGVNVGAAIQVPFAPAFEVSYSTNLLTGGNHSITAVYTGDQYYSAASSTLQQSVNRQNTATTVTANPSSPTPGQSTTLTASVVFSPDVGGFQPGGTVQFYDGASPLGSPVSMTSGQASLVTAALALGTHSITAVYSGDANGNPSTSAALNVIVQAASGGGGSGDVPLPPWATAMLAAGLLATIARYQRSARARG
jgi:hypothetical protein